MTIPLGIFNPAQAAFLLGIAAVLGACLGSFVNCLAWRLANGESVLAGRSHCTSCGHVLGALDLVPVASWLALRGRCRHCGQRVSPRYVIVEALVAALFAAVVARYGLSVQTAAYLVLVCILMAVALVDLDTFIIPNGFVVAGCVLWLVSIWFMPAPRVDAFSVGSLFSGWVHPGGAVALDGIVGAAVVAGGVLVLSVAFDKVTKRRSLGGGDVKLLFMVGLFLGLAGSMLNLLMACLMGLAFAFAQGFSVPSSPGEGEGEGESVRTRVIPFGPAIAAATAFTLLAGPTILTWYAGLF